MPIGTFALAMVMTALSVWAIERVEDQRREGQARAAASVVATALDRRAHSYVSYLRAGSLMLGTRKDPTREDFESIAGGLLDDADYHGALGIGWLPVLKPAQIPAFEKRMNTAGQEGYTVHPAPDPASRMVVPVGFIADMNERNRPTLGFDTYSEPKRRAVIDQAIARRQLTASGPVSLIMQTRAGEWQGFLLFMPVYGPGQTDLPRGFISAPFNAGAFLSSIVVLEKIEDLEVRLYDGAMESSRLIARTGAQGASMHPVATQALTLGGRRLLVAVDAPEGGLTRTAWVALMLGTTIALLLAVVARIVSRRAEQDREALLWLREQASIRASLTRELNHRVKNTLANVLSLIALTKRRATGLDEFVEGLQGRIRALSATHDLLTNSEWGPTALRDVVLAEVAPYTRGDDAAVALSGPDVDLAPNDALSLGLALHELATNASKYGSLSVATGRVDVSWAMVGEGVVQVHWQESDGPPVPALRSRGFGTDLIEKIVAHELGHGVQLDFAVTGVRCTLMVPVRAPVAFSIRARQQNGQGKGK
ncbi:CHASE domain-containing protein [Novosphingobium terrae]|uniref:CHASE domain-containing protein n=1 Tax=Novosphingobium terrae TaxID=2726189 RepID=UPI001F14034D|nr:CHASE domain-containing protein [Novosphingobium terrae]